MSHVTRPYLKDYYFTFGFAHVHHVNGNTFDKDCVAVIAALNYDAARETAVRYFGTTWCMQHQNLVDVGMEYYPRGLIRV